jgi:hypothetical protein
MGVKALRVLTRRLPISLVRLAPSWMRLAAEAKAKSRSTELALSDSQTTAGELFSDG